MEESNIISKNNVWIENNAWMCGNVKYISNDQLDILRVSKVNEWDILFNNLNKFHISKHSCIVLLLFKDIALLPHKNRAKTLMYVFHDNRHMWDIDFIIGWNVNKTLYFI